ncbi:hypothetical protein SBP28_004724 [Candidozyma auris]
MVMRTGLSTRAALHHNSCAKICVNVKQAKSRRKKTNTNKAESAPRRQRISRNNTFVLHHRRMAVLSPSRPLSIYMGANSHLPSGQYSYHPPSNFSLSFLVSPNMKLSLVLALSSAASAASTWTWTRTVTNNGMTYTKTGAEEYTGQATTEPTSGTVTTTHTIKKSDMTYTKTMTNTYGQATTITTHYVVSGPDATYTRPMTAAMHTTEVSSFLSSHSSHLSAASAAAKDASKNPKPSSSSASSGTSATSSGSSSSKGAGAALEYGAKVGAFGVAAALLL